MISENPMSILLVEDDDIDAENLRRSLPKDCSLKRSKTLSDAIESLRADAADLILLDPGLPDCSGVDSFLKIRKSAPKLPVVILTGLEDRELAVRIIRLGAQDYLLKNQLDARAMQALRFAVERESLLKKIEEEQAERERLAAELREQEQRLAHMGRVTLVGELVAEVTHEVSQPLNVISSLTGALEASLQSQEPNSQQTSEFVRKISNASTHAREILRRLRDFIRYEAIPFEDFDMRELLETTFEFVEFERQRRGVMIRHHIEQKNLTAHGNRTQIQQVVVNLLRNAFDAMTDTPEGQRQVELTAFRDNDMITVEVSDRGTGLDIDVASAFSAFNTTKSTGLGMGLAICTRILQNHKGMIRYIEKDAPGATFLFSIPSARDVQSRR